VVLLVLAAAHGLRLFAGACAAIAADALWVAGTAAVLATVTMPTNGRMLLAATGAVVGVVAVLQWRALRGQRVT
jgi:hypothetical protein